MKKCIAFALIIIYMLTLAGCNSSGASCEDTVKNYLAHIKAGEYSEAWDLLSSSARNVLETSASNRITRDEFINKYTGIFTDLGISDISYYNVKVEAGELMASASFTATYYSSVIGDITDEFTFTLMRESGKWYVDWTPALIFPEMQWGDTVRIATLGAKRGEIFASGELVAATVGKVSVYVSPSKIDDESLLVSQLARLLDMKESAVEKNLKKAYDDVAIIKQCYTDQLSASTREQLLSISGVGIDEGNYGTQREYPYGSMLSHIIGYTGKLTASSNEALQTLIDEYNEGRGEYDGKYTSDSVVGKVGIESKYEKELRGTDGIRIYVATAEGTNRRTLYELPASDGLDIHLTIDLKLQKRLDEVLELLLYGETVSGAVVVMNPLTGEIQAMESFPSYDLNLFTRGISDKDYKALTDDARKPLYNKLTQGLYPPGSVFKTFTAAAVLDNDTLSTDFVINGDIEDDYWTPTEFGPWEWSKIKRTKMNYRTEPLNMRNAILNSDNIYFAYAALKLGDDKFLSYMRNLGFEESIDFDINVATPQLLNEDTEFTLKFLADSGYGQGEILVTPLQLACEFSAVANGGDIAVPRVIDSMYQTNGIRYKLVYESEKKLWKTNVISDEALSTLIPYLENVTDRAQNGTGRKLKARNVKVAAKTGTAEIGDDKSREIAWFAGFRTGVSDEDARLVLVMLEVPSSGEFNDTKFDIAREMLSMEASD